MSDIADKIYAATGLVLGTETAAAMERFIKQEKRDALAEAAREVDCQCGPRRDRVLEELKNFDAFHAQQICPCDHACSALKAAEIRALSDTPSGMVLVPLEPTSKMHDAGFAVSVGGLLGEPMGYDFCTANRRIWIAMVEAAEKGEGND
jgi:hypothetical protein